MIHFVYLSVIVGLALLLAMYVCSYEKQRKLGLELLEWLETETRAYESLDAGMVELQDAYETDSLQYEDTIKNLHGTIDNVVKESESKDRQIARVQENNSTLLHNAQIDRTARHQLQRRNDEQALSISGLRRQLDIAQVIISEHDLNCLPHIVLKSMEPQEQDTPLPI